MYRFELYHHGTKGMKWGVRRYQNKDGSLTNAGAKRYARDAREKEYNKYDDAAGKYYKTSKKSGRSDLEADPRRYAKEDLERTKRLTDSASQLTGSMQRMNKSAMDRNAKNRPKMDLSSMSDKEMREQINRALLEKQYNDMFAPQKTSKGREYAADILEIAGNTLAVTSSALAIALAVKELRG